MPLSITEPKNQRGIEIMNEALAAELAGHYSEALEFYCESSRLLHRARHNLTKRTEEARRVELQIRAVTERKTLLQVYLKEGGQPPQPLPSTLLVQHEESSAFSGWISLTSIELGRRSPLLTDDSSAPSSSHHHQVVSLLTFLLPTSLPTITYHVYSEMVERWDGLWLYINVKDANKTQTLYTLEAHKRPYRKITRTTLSRSAEYHSPALAVKIAPVENLKFDLDSRQMGRPFKITFPGRKEGIIESPDCVHKIQWNPRRFTYGGQRFVWKDSKHTGVSSLYEVIREWPNPHSKTGKMLDEVCSRPLMWGESKWAKDKLCTIHFVGGLDQRFREFVLTSELTKQLIQIHD